MSAPALSAAFRKSPRASWYVCEYGSMAQPPWQQIYPTRFPSLLPDARQDTTLPTRSRFLKSEIEVRQLFDFDASEALTSASTCEGTRMEGCGVAPLLYIDGAILQRYRVAKEAIATMDCAFNILAQ